MNKGSDRVGLANIKILVCALIGFDENMGDLYYVPLLWYMILQWLGMHLYTIVICQHR